MHTSEAAKKKSLTKYVIPKSLALECPNLTGFRKGRQNSQFKMVPGLKVLLGTFDETPQPFQLDRGDSKRGLRPPFLLRLPIFLLPFFGSSPTVR